MIGLRKLKGRYYARVYVKDCNGNWKDKLIPLNTDQIVKAEVRRTEVRQFEQLIKAGGEFIPSWSNNGKAEVKQYTLPDAINDFIKARKGDGLRASTLELYKQSLDILIPITGKRLPVKDITGEHIDSYKSRFVNKKKKLSPVTLNMRLRSIKTFLFWLKERGKIECVPVIKQINTGNSKPIYLTNDQFNKILETLDELGMKDPTEPDHLRRVFHFYRETGCRRSEPFDGEINGNFLTIKADTAKGHSERDIYLNDNQIAVLLEMRKRVDEKVRRLSRGKLSKIDKIKSTAIGRYSRLFKDSCKKAEITGRKFHSLRHTTAVRLYLATRDIYRVMKQLGHSSVTTTEVYSKFDIKRLEQDFPDLVKEQIPGQKQNSQKKGNMANSDTVFPETSYPYYA